MKKVKHTLPKEARKLYRRVKRNRSKAIRIGLWYLLATVAMAALAVLPTLNVANIAVIPGMSDNGMLWENLNLGANIDTVSRALYAIVLLTVVINVFKALGKLGWLLKKKASKTYGFNRNVYAMQDLGKIFSSSFAAILINFVLIALLNGNYAGADKFDFAGFDALLAPFIVEIQLGPIALTNALVIVAVGAVFHFWLAFRGAKVSFFVAQKYVGITEDKRLVGRFAPLFRNFLQVVVSLGIAMFLLQVSKISGWVAGALEGNIATDDLTPIVQLVIFVFWMVLVRHATNVTEYNFFGAEGKGMGNFKWFIFLTLVASLALYYFEDSAFSFDLSNVLCFNTLMIVALSFVMFVIEMLMRKAPVLPVEEDEEEVEEEEEEEEEEEIVETDDVDWTYFFSEEFGQGMLIR